MKRWISGLLCLLILAAPGHAWTEFTKTKIAVLDFELQGERFETKDMGAIVAEWFVTALVKTGRFDVIERALLKKILQEQKLGMTGLLDEDTVTKIGKLLGVKVIISGSVMRLQNVMEINARIIDVETASIIAAESVRSATPDRLQDLVGEMSRKIIRNFPLEGYVVQREGEHITIDLGRIAGVHPGMQFAAYREGKVIKHPRTGAVLSVQRIETGRFKVTSVRDTIAEGILLEEKAKNAVAYGQSVSSLTEALRPESGRLYVDTDPDDARIRILDTEASFKQGMRLDPGRYRLEVSANGYRKKTQWITLEAGADKNVSIRLAKIESEAPPTVKPSGSAPPARPPVVAPSVEILPPGVIHNVMMNGVNGMSITIQGAITNAWNKSGQVVVRFFMPNGQALFANPQEFTFRDASGLVAVGTNRFPIPERRYPLGNITLFIPYYALNMQPTGGNMTYQLGMQGFVYIDGFERARSQITSFLLRW
jgi:TolB-like protein